MTERAFWQRKPLQAMTTDEWESLCDGCGKCCLHKLEDEDTGEVHYTNVACRLLDTDTCRCGDYAHRRRQVPDCLVLTPGQVAAFHWLPESCAYRRLAEGRPLPAWHPLLTGERDSARASGHSVAGRVVPESDVDEEELEQYIVHWVDEA